LFGLLTLTQQGMTELMKHQIYLFVLLTFTQQGMTELMKHQIYLLVLLTLTQQGMTELKGQTNKFDVSSIQSYLVV
jgi:uncharacterized protein with GYD domain